jgi:hypothetical protein
LDSLCTDLLNVAFEAVTSLIASNTMKYILVSPHLFRVYSQENAGQHWTMELPLLDMAQKMVLITGL